MLLALGRCSLPCLQRPDPLPLRMGPPAGPPASAAELSESRYEWPNGDVYEGQWLSKVLHGHGVYKYGASGSVYVSPAAFPPQGCRRGGGTMVKIGTLLLIPHIRLRQEK